jgi:hypothetical protein
MIYEGHEEMVWSKKVPICSMFLIGPGFFYFKRLELIPILRFIGHIAKKRQR